MGEKLGFTPRYKVMNNKDGVNLTLPCTSCAENLSDLWSVILGAGADKSLAQPGRKQSTATKLGTFQHTPHETQYTS